MSDDRAFDRAVGDWLAQGSDRTPPAAVDGVLLAIRTTPQERHLRFPWRTPTVSLPFRLTAAAVVVVVVGFAGVRLVTPPTAPGATPTPTATASPTSTGPATTPSETTELEAFTSTRYGYTVQHPASWGVSAATEDWPAGTIADPNLSSTDRLRPAASPLAIVAIAAQPIPDAATGADWLADYAALRESVGGPCVGPASDWTDATLAGLPARRIEGRCNADGGSANFVEYAFVIDRTGFVITGNVPSVVELIAASFQTS
jgi:hypothetical protein